MFQYTNGFACAVDTSKNEVIVKFLQKVPDMDSNGNVKEVIATEVADIVMNINSALELSNAIKDLCEAKTNTIEE